MSSVLNKYILVGRAHSAPTSLMSAGNSALDYSAINNNLPSINQLTGSSNEMYLSLSPEYAVYIKLIFLYALRFSELYRAKINDIVYPDRIILTGSKKSAGSLIYVPKLSEIAKDVPNNTSLKIFPNVVYKKCYCIIKKLNIIAPKMNYHNVAATHLGRKLIDILTNGLLSDRLLSDTLRHRSEKTSSYYRKKKDDCKNQ